MGGKKGKMKVADIDGNIGDISEGSTDDEATKDSNDDGNKGKAKIENEKTYRKLFEPSFRHWIEARMCR